MKQIKFIKYTILCLFVIFSVTTSAQVTIGSEYEPEKGALLDLKQKQTTPSQTDIASLENASKGMLFPKVRLVAYNQLAPLYGTPTGNPDSQSMLKATGMTVYNVNKDATQLKVGPYYWNGKEWKPLVIDETQPEGPRFFFTCGDVRTNTQLKKGQPSSATTDKILIDVVFEQEGAEYVIETDEKNGVKFRATGQFSGSDGKQTITLVADGGTPTEAGTFLYTIFTNSLELDICENVNVTVASDQIPARDQIHVVLLSNSQSNLGPEWDIYYPGNLGDKSVRKILENKKIFGPDNNAIVKVQNVKVTFLGRDDGDNHTELDGLTKLLNSNDPNEKVDIVLTGHEVAFNMDVTKEAALEKFVKQDHGVLIYCSDIGWFNGSHVDRRISIDHMFTRIFGKGVTVPDDGKNGPDVMQLIDNADIVNGPVYNLHNLYVGRDGGWNCDIRLNELTTDAQVLAYGKNSSYARIIKHKDYGFIFIGDGGFFSGGNYSHAINHKDYHPCLVDGNGMPIKKNTPKSIYIKPEANVDGVYNAQFLTNILVWAMNYRMKFP